MRVFEAKDICKTFPGVKALDHVDFYLESGEVHALCGANGAGKSTIIKIIAGIQSADSGKMYLEGKEVSFRSPNAAYEAGIGTIFQDFEQAQNLTVAENISLGKLKEKGKATINWKEVRSRAINILNDLQINIDPDEIVENLGVGERQMIEIARVMSHNVKILIMDEPTSSLSSEDVETLFKLIRRLTAQGVSIVYVSHRMEEVFAIADRVTVFRDGKLRMTALSREVSASEIISAMIGDKTHKVEYRRGYECKETILEAKEIKSDLIKTPLSFDLKKKEILGIAGVMGSGRTELMLSLFGLGGPVSGSIYIDGEKYTPSTPSAAMKAGLAMVPEDRHNAGVFPNLSVKHNVVLTCLQEIKKHGYINYKSESDLVDGCIDKFHVKTPGADTLVSTLSGGNQQKVVFAKWLSTEKKVLLLDEPTRGIDVGAKAEIYSLTSELVDNGLSVILVSSELKELLDICDRILIMRNGEFIEEVSRKDFDYTIITQKMMSAVPREE